MRKFALFMLVFCVVGTQTSVTSALLPKRAGWKILGASALVLGGVQAWHSYKEGLEKEKIICKLRALLENESEMKRKNGIKRHLKYLESRQTLEKFLTFSTLLCTIPVVFKLVSNTQGEQDFEVDYASDAQVIEFHKGELESLRPVLERAASPCQREETSQEFEVYKWNVMQAMKLYEQKLEECGKGRDVGLDKQAYTLHRLQNDRRYNQGVTEEALKQAAPLEYALVQLRIALDKMLRAHDKFATGKEQGSPT